MRSAFALRINSGRIIFMFGIAERLRAFRYPIFTGGVVEEAAAAALVSCGNIRAAKPHTLHSSRKVFRHAKGSPFGRAGIEQREMTERARTLAVLQKALPEMIRPPLPRSGTSFCA